MPTITNDRYSRTYLENVFQRFFNSETGLFDANFAAAFGEALRLSSDVSVLNNGLQVTGVLGVTGSLGVTGAGVIGANLDVLGDSFFTGAASFGNAVGIGTSPSQLLFLYGNNIALGAAIVTTQPTLYILSLGTVDFVNVNDFSRVLSLDVISTDGHVGIGKPAALANTKLDVAGSITASGSILSATVLLIANTSVAPAIIATDASLGDLFVTTITTGSFTAPTNPQDGHLATWRWRNGSSTIPQLATFSVGTGGWRWPAGANATGSPALIPTAPLKTDYLQAIYNRADNFWDVVRVVQGF